LTSGTVIVTKIDKVKFRVGEIYSLIDNIQSQAIRPIDLRAYDSGTISAVHTDSFDSRVFSPISPKQPTGSERL